MAHVPIKDKNYKVIAFVETQSNGNKVLKTPDYRTLGFYDAKSDTTKDNQFRTVGHGDLLTSLIEK